MQLLLALVGNDREHRRLAQYLTAHRVDGVLLVSVHADDPLPDLLEQLGMPAAMSGRRWACETLASVDSDNFAGAGAAVGHLVSRGRRAIATISGPGDVHGAQRRLDGYREALSEAGLEPDEWLIAPADVTEEGGARAMRELLARRPDVDAVFAASDVMAAGARQVLRETGRRGPDDVALIGFDDSAVARHMDPALTSVRRPIEETGRTTARVLLTEIASGHQERPQIVLPTELVVRDSS